MYVGGTRNLKEGFGDLRSIKNKITLFITIGWILNSIFSILKNQIRQWNRKINERNENNWKSAKERLVITLMNRIARITQWSHFNWALFIIIDYLHPLLPLGRLSLTLSFTWNEGVYFDYYYIQIMANEFILTCYI